MLTQFLALFSAAVNMRDEYASRGAIELVLMDAESWINTVGSELEVWAMWREEPRLTGHRINPPMSLRIRLDWHWRATGYHDLRTTSVVTCGNFARCRCSVDPWARQKSLSPL